MLAVAELAQPHASLASLFTEPLNGFQDEFPCAAGAGVGGSNATCVNVATQASFGESGTGGGGLGFTAVNGTNEGYRPFAGKSTLDFWLKSNSTGPGDQSEVMGNLGPCVFQPCL